jgi:hypothetical protein
MGTTTSNLGLYKPTIGETGWGDVLHYDTALSLANVNIAGAGLASKWGGTWATAS